MIDTSTGFGILRFADQSGDQKLYERSVQIDILRQLAAGLCADKAPTRVCLVAGASGLGKTTLCELLKKDCITIEGHELKGGGENIRQQWEDQIHGHNHLGCVPIFISGKADQYEDFGAPYSVIVDAFDQLGQVLINRRRHLFGECTTVTGSGDGTSNFHIQPYCLDRRSGHGHGRATTGTADRTTDKNMQLLKSSLSFEGSILTELIPSFARLFSGGAGVGSSTRSKNNDNDDDGLSGRQEGNHNTNKLELAPERLSVAFRSFLRLVCTPENPIIFHVDDLHWMDSNSLDVLAAIIDDTATTNFMFLGSFRTEEEGRLRHFLNHLEGNLGRSKIVRVDLVGLTLQGVQNLIRDLLDWEEGDKLSAFSGLLLQKTSGNPYYLSELLAGLNREGILTFDTSSMNWDVNIERVRHETERLENVNFFVVKRIQELPSSTRHVLIMISCIGFSANIELLEIIHHFWIHLLRRHSERTQGQSQERYSISKEPLHDVRDLLFSARSSGDLLRTSRNQVREAIAKGRDEGLLTISDSHNVKFTHDRIQEGFYSLILAHQQAHIHLSIGRTILEVYNVEPGRHDLIFVAADQCNRGSKAITKEEERLLIMKLNVKASKVAQSKAGVALASKFLEKAVSLVTEDDWDGPNYELILEIFNLSAEVEFARGAFDRCNQRIKTILEKSRTQEDSVRAMAVHALSLGTRGDYSNALVEANRALKILGIHVPEKLRQLRLYSTVIQLNKKIKAMTDVDLMKLPMMNDSRMILAMKILQAAHMWGWNVDPIFGRLATVEMMKATLTNGICYLGPFAIAGFGNLVANILHDESEAFRLVLMSQRLDELEKMEGTPARIMVSHCYLFHLRQPIYASLEPFLMGYRLSLKVGDITNGAICLCNYLWVYGFCGLPLDVYISDMKMYLSELKLCQQDFVLAFLLPDFHFALGLAGSSDDSQTISWTTIQRSDHFVYNTSIAEQHPAHLKLLYVQIFNALILDDTRTVQLGLDSIFARKPLFRRFDGTHLCNQFFTFYDGLASFAILQKCNKKNERKRYLNVANDSIRWLHRMSKAGSINCLGLLHLLLAEKKALTATAARATDMEEVRMMYNEAIVPLTRTGFIHYAALANERAGKFMLNHAEDEFWGGHYLSRSATLFREWGAVVKVEQLTDQFPTLVTIDGSSSLFGSSLNVHAKRKFDSKYDSIHNFDNEDMEVTRYTDQRN